MSRPQCCRRIAGRPVASLFRPEGNGGPPSEEIVLSLDEFEAIRLADLEGMYQEQAAERMNVSRPTLGRILTTAHRKIAEALTHGKSIRIEGGTIRVEKACPFRCKVCVLDENGVPIGTAECPRISGLKNETPPPCPGLQRRRRGCKNII